MKYWGKLYIERLMILYRETTYLTITKMVFMRKKSTTNAITYVINAPDKKIGVYCFSESK